MKLRKKETIILDILKLICNHKIVRKETLTKLFNGKGKYICEVIRRLQDEGFNIRRFKLNSKTFYMIEQRGIK